VKAKKPDVMLIDGGKGQLGVALSIIKSLDITDIQLIGVAKGVTRKAGFETLILPQEGTERLKEVTLPSESPALHLIQHIRDESHRFAITGHRKRRDKSRKVSRLESLSGVGAKRRQELLKYFGDKGALMRANVDEIAKVKGISRHLAENIYEQLHEQ
jgi:excinuclease ABC subunit C